MRIEIVDDMGYLNQINSRDLDLLGRWFAEKAKLLMSADCRYNHPVRIDIWPEDPGECELIPVAHQPVKFTQDGLLEFAQHILDVAAKVGEREASCPA